MRVDTRTERAGEGDLAAFCAAEHPRLVGTLALYTGDAQLGEELAQEALARICRDWRRWPSVDWWQRSRWSRW